MTETAIQTARNSELLRNLTLQSIVLWDCAVERGEATEVSAGAVTGSIEAGPGDAPDGFIAVLVEGKWDFENADGEQLVSISATYAVTYEGSLPDGLGDEDFMRLGRSAITQVTPFHREFLGSMTNRLGMPPFYLPLMRSSDMKLATRDDEEID